MFRRVLSYHLVFALAAGPLLCCCTAGRALASAMSAPFTMSDLRQGSPTIHAESPCCVLKKFGKKGNTGRKPSEPNHCPCKGGNGQQVKIQPETTSTDATPTRVLALDYSAAYVFAGVDAAISLGRSESRTGCGTSLFCPPTLDLLFAHHNLRC
jgi:hypothetical protein